MEMSNGIIGAKDLLLFITKDKEHNISLGIAQNIKQLTSSLETNKKRKRDYYFNYLYGVVTTGRDWLFLLYTTGVISKCSKLPYTIKFTDDTSNENSEEYHTLFKDMKKILSIIVG